VSSETFYFQDHRPVNSSNKSTLSPTFKNLILLIIGLSAGWIMGEIGLRVIGFSDIQFSRWDSRLGITLRPNVEGWFTSEGRTYVRINSDGLRDREHSKEKPENTIRIAVLGDSYAAARHVEMEQSFWHIMGKELADCAPFSHKQVEVINFGVSGYGTDRELLMLRHKAWDYDPDIVLLAFFHGNDLRDNSNRLNPKDKGPFFYYKDNKLMLDTSFNQSEYFLTRQKWHYRFFYWFTNKSRVFQLANKMRLYMGNGKKKKQTKNLHEAGLDSAVYQIPKDEAMQEAWRITEDLLVMTRDEVNQKGAKFYVTTLTDGIQVHIDKNHRQEFMKNLGVDNLGYPTSRIKELGKKENFPVLNLFPPFQRYADENQVYLHGPDDNLGKGHWNKNGHRLGGEMMADFICQDLSNPPELAADTFSPKT
jgi:hypothetical protein